jgi:predicted permease
MPGVLAAAAVKDPPMRGVGERIGFRVPGRVVPPGEDPPTSMAIHVSDSYFSTIGARVVDGREFLARDRAGTPLVFVVNEAFARQFFPGQRAVGQRLIVGRDQPAEIIGVVGDIRQVTMADAAPPAIYLHNLQNSRVKTTIVARTAGDPYGHAGAIRDAIWALDPAQPITAVFTFDEAISRSMSRPRLLAVLLGAFGLIGLALGAIGVYGLQASTVTERYREIGVRLALGAKPAHVLGAVVGQGLATAAVGAALGLAMAAALAQYLTTVLFGIRPTDPPTFVVTVGVLLGAAALSSWIPARRAARINPVDALRH